MQVKSESKWLNQCRLGSVNSSCRVNNNIVYTASITTLMLEAVHIFETFVYSSENAGQFFRRSLSSIYVQLKAFMS
jgi:hypothetical protein